MRKVALLLLLPGLVAIKSASAQSTPHLKLSDQYPAAGETIVLTYDPDGTPLAGKPKFDAMVYFLDNKVNPAADIDFKPDGKLFTGSVTIPADTKFFFIKLSQDAAIDNNSDQGYTSFIYKNQAPVQGAYALKAYMLFSGMGMALDKIKTDIPQAFTLYQKEFELFPQSKLEYQTNYTAMLTASPDPAVKALAGDQVAQMAQSGDEKTMTTAVSLLRRLKKTAQADSLAAVIKIKFPDNAAKTEMGLAFNKEKDPAQKEVLYNAYIVKYPENAADKKPIQDNFRMQLAVAYLQAGKFDDYDRIIAQVKDKSNLPPALNNAAYDMAKKDENLDKAGKLSKLSLDLVSEKMKNPEPMAYQSPKSLVKVYKSNYGIYADTYAYILSKQGKYEEALTYEQPVFTQSKGADADINENYALILKGLGRNKEAMQVIEDAIKSGKSTTPMIAALEEIYVKNNGSEKGYDAYVAPLKAIYMQKLRTDLAKEMINKPAPMFALKDLKGKTVSLADLKGKVVIVDFWATWCGPCKASFPGMQMALNKYKDNPNVKFVFIDTWEREENYLPGVKKFIADSKYTFNVLMDEKDNDGKQAKIVTAYGVEGIPTKFVLDGNGNIRFKHIGFSGGADELVDEVSIMIDMAAHPDANPVQGKVSMIKTQ